MKQAYDDMKERLDLYQLKVTLETGIAGGYSENDTGAAAVKARADLAKANSELFDYKDKIKSAKSRYDKLKKEVAEKTAEDKAIKS